MKKKSIVDAGGNDFVEAAKPITGVVPLGNQVLVERLSEGELSGSSLIIEVQDKPSNQAYVLAMGPQVNKEYGLKIGDRVLLQGSFVPVPVYGDSKRERNLVFPDMIKAILTQ